MNTKTTMQFSPVGAEERKKLNLKSGSNVRVWVKIKEKDKIRLQAFEGMVIAVKHGVEPGATFTVRAVYDGVGVERIFPLFSPAIDKIEVLSRLKTRRAKLYYIREKAAKQIRKRMKTLTRLNPFAKKDNKDIEDIKEDAAVSEQLAPLVEAEQETTAELEETKEMEEA